MFDGVSGRYDLLNRLMTLGQDGAWRSTMWHAVPDSARTCLDLCTGNGVSLPGLARPGRLVIGVDVSLGMLESAWEHVERPGWAPRLVCADGFRLPLRDGSVDAVTVAFGMRNLRPRASALAEIRRVLAPDGTLVVLEACAPRPGAFAPFHAFHLRHVVPLLGRLSPDPSAYLYLRDSIFEFGDGTSFEQDLSGGGFRLIEERPFLLGATRLWVARSPRPHPALQNASAEAGARGEMPNFASGRDREWSLWGSMQLVLAATLFAALIYGLFRFAEVAKVLPLEGWQRWGLALLLAGGAIGFGLRTVLLALRLRTPPPPR